MYKLPGERTRANLYPNPVLTSENIQSAPDSKSPGTIAQAPMLDTVSALLDMPVTPVLAAELHSHPMLETDSALFDYFCAPVLAAEFAFAFPHTPLLVMPHA